LVSSLAFSAFGRRGRQIAARRAAQAASARRSFARLLLQEVEAFQSGYYSAAAGAITNVTDPSGNALQVFTTISPCSFSVFPALAREIGVFRQPTLVAVVSFCRKAQTLIEDIARLNESYKWEIAGPGRGRAEERADCVKQFRSIKAKITDFDTSIEAARHELKVEAGEDVKLSAQGPVEGKP
jgi:hypothetical protein